VILLNGGIKMSKFYVNIDYLRVLKSKEIEVLLAICNLLKFEKSVKVSCDEILSELGLDYVYEDYEKDKVINIIHELLDYEIIDFPEKEQDTQDYFTISLCEDVMTSVKRKPRITRVTK
jgi:hypothetical protein